jgi:hypothetical protein
MASMRYKMLIRSHLEYCASVLFTCNLKIIKSLQKIENRCLRIIDPFCNKDDIRKLYMLPPLNARFKYFYLLNFYKLLNKIVPLIDDCLMPHKSHANFTRLAETGGVLLRGGVWHRSVHTFGAKIFNELTVRIRCASTLRIFKSYLKDHLFY